MQPYYQNSACINCTLVMLIVKCVRPIYHANGNIQLCVMRLISFAHTQ